VAQDRQKVDLEQYPCRSIPLPALSTMRRNAALSQKELARLASVAPNTVRLLESGRRGAYPTTLRKLDSVISVAPAELTREHRPEESST